MIENEHFKRLERMFLKAPYNQQLYQENAIEISREQAIISTRVMEKHFHGAGAMHGSVYFKLLDDAAFFAVNSMVRDYMVYTIFFNINLIRPVGQGIARAEGKVKEKTRTLFIAESNLYDAKGKLAAWGTGSFMRSQIKLEEMPEYIKDLDQV